MIKNEKWFTLIELMVVITIISMISLATYLPYAHHQKKVLLKQANREISQSLSEARNLATNGLDTGSGNLNVALYLDEQATQIVYYTSTGFIDFLNMWQIYKTKQLPQGIQIDAIAWNSEKSIFSFSAIFGTGSLEQESSGIFTGDIIDISSSYKWSSSPVLQGKIIYYMRSYISDY